jgi:Lrp/AsnC family transcriptional regulator for asnA, asnC and gidA
MAILGLQIDRSYQSQIEEALRAIPEVRFVGLTLGAMI